VRDVDERRDRRRRARCEHVGVAVQRRCADTRLWKPIRTIDVTLQNQGSSTPLPANFLLFSVETNQALVVQAGPASGGVSPACDPQTSVGTGGSYTCDPVFEIPQDQWPVTLHYDDAMGQSAYGPVPALPPVVTDVTDTITNYYDNDFTVSFSDVVEPVVSYSFHTDDGQISDDDVPLDTPATSGTFDVTEVATTILGSITVHVQLKSASGVVGPTFDKTF
jgi:hypothetical protein